MRRSGTSLAYGRKRLTRFTSIACLKRPVEKSQAQALYQKNSPKISVLQTAQAQTSFCGEASFWNPVLEHSGTRFMTNHRACSSAYSLMTDRRILEQFPDRCPVSEDICLHCQVLSLPYEHRPPHGDPQGHLTHPRSFDKKHASHFPTLRKREANRIFAADHVHLH